MVDARLKIIVGLALLIMVLSYKGMVFPLIVAVLCFALCTRLKIPARIFLLRFSEPAFIILIVVLIKCFFTGNEVIFSVHLFGGTLAGHKDGLMDGLFIAARILSAVSVVALLGFATAFTDFITGLAWFRVPSGFVEILMFAYRYIFVILDEALVIYNSQKNRLGYSNITRGLNSLGILTGSLVIRAFDHSQGTTLAMIQRGYDGTIPRSKHHPFKAPEIIGCTLFLFALGVVWTI